MALLNQADKEVDKTTAGIIIADTKIKQLMKKSSTCCLWVIIIAELALVGLFTFLIITK